MKSTIATAHALAEHLQQMQRLLKDVSGFGRLAVALMAFKTSTSPVSIALLASAGRLRRAAALRSEIRGQRRAHSLEPTGDRSRTSSHSSGEPSEDSTVAHPLPASESLSRIHTKHLDTPLIGGRLIATLRPPRILVPDAHSRSSRSTSPRIFHSLQTLLVRLAIANNMYSYAAAAVGGLSGRYGEQHKMKIRAALEFGRPASPSWAAPGPLPEHSSQPLLTAAREKRPGRSSSRGVASYARMPGQIRRPRGARLSLNPGIARIAGGLRDVIRIHAGSRGIRSIERAFSPGAVIRPALMNIQRAGSSLRITPTGYLYLQAVPQTVALSGSPRQYSARQSSVYAGGARPVTISYAPQIVIHSANGSDDTRFQRRVMEILERHGRELYQVLARESLRRKRAEFTQSQAAELRFSEAG